MHVVDGVEWSSRRERLWAHVLLAYTEGRISWDAAFEKRARKREAAR
jgi:hypothetical protein